MAGRVQDKVAIVIGAARGIGAAIAERLLEEGAHVVIADTRAAEGAATARRLGQRGDATFVLADVSRKEAVDALVEATLRRHGRVDIMVQNAGIFPYTLLPDIAVEEWDAVLGVNLRGCFLAIQACARPMRSPGGCRSTAGRCRTLRISAGRKSIRRCGQVAPAGYPALRFRCGLSASAEAPKRQSTAGSSEPRSPCPGAATSRFYTDCRR